MKYEPPIDRPSLLSFLRDSYGIDARGLQFVAVGMVACSYAVLDEGGQPRWFLKLLGTSRLAQISRAQQEFTLPVMDKLAKLGHAVPGVLRAGDGSLTGQFGEWTSALHPYLPGPTLMDLPAPPPGYYGAIGAAVGGFHRDTPLLKLDPAGCPFVERYQPHWKPTLRVMIKELKQVGARHRRGQVALQELLLPEEERLWRMVARMDELARQVRAFDPPLVLVHTDLNGSNIILGEDGTLWLLDWEGAMLAPAEHDLFLYTGEGFEEVIEGYRRVMGVDHLHAEAFGYNFYRRNLEDLTDWMVTILRENTLDIEDEGDLEGIHKDCVSGWDWIEPQVEKVRGVLEGMKGINEGSSIY